MRKLVVLFAFMTTVGFVAIAPPASAEAGALDHSFGGDGRVTTEGPVESRASDVLVDDDGNLVAIGSAMRLMPSATPSMPRSCAICPTVSRT